MVIKSILTSFVKSARIGNLAIIALTMYLYRYFLLEPLLAQNYIKLVLSNFYFNLLVFSTLSIALAGYLINDYFDKDIDKINKPQSNLLSSNSLYFLYWLFTILGIIGAIFIYIQIKNINIVVIYLFTTGALWFYSSEFKKILIVGNLVISFLTSLVILLVFWTDMYLISIEYQSKIRLLDLNLFYIIYWTIAYSGFAFILNLSREIVKDIEDFEGDKSYGCNTIPVVYGISASRFIALGLIAIAQFFLYWGIFNYVNEIYSLLFGFIFIGAPLLYVSILLFYANSFNQFKRISLIIKLIIFLGVCYPLILYIYEFN